MTMKVFFLVVLLAVLGEAQSQLSCDDAIKYHNYALSVLQGCGSGSDNSSLCELVGNYEEDAGQNSESPEANDQLSFISNPVSNVQPWQDYLTQSALSSVADPGEIAYIINVINNSSYSTIDSENATVEDYYGNWAQAWWAQADANLALANDPDNNDQRAVQMYNWKASNYLFTGSWPMPFGEEAMQRSVSAANAFRAGVEANPTWSSQFFTVPFNNGTATAQLPGIFITPDSSRPLPTILLTTGTDYTKEATVLQFGLEALARGYAVVAYDGPGQGAVLRNPPYMPFFADWGQVLSVVLDYVEANLANLIQVDKIAQYGVSLGGYLGSRGCAANSERLAACVPDPPQFSVVPVYERFSQGLAEGVYGAVQYAAQTEPSSLPPGYAAVFNNPIPIIDALLLTCGPDTAAPTLITEAFQFTPGVIDPELVYLAAGYGGVVSGDEDTLYTGLWQGFRNTQSFGQYNVSDITCPVVALKSTEDDLLGGQEDEWFSQLSPATQDISTLLTFDDTTGAALHCQVGAPLIAAGKLFQALNPILMGTGGTAPSQSPAALPVLPASG